jgi:vacuolar-type H+-ATPase subunit B/Vma2
MVTFHIKLDYLESVEIVLSALQECSNPDARAIADGILRTLIRVEDGIATHFGGQKLPPTSPDNTHTNTRTNNICRQIP